MSHLKEWMPCEIVADGVVVAVVRDEKDKPSLPEVTHPKVHSGHTPRDLPFSKGKQADKRGFNA